MELAHHAPHQIAVGVVALAESTEAPPRAKNSEPGISAVRQASAETSQIGILPVRSR
ncbi:MAG: hypothetical protein RIC55_00350 [Pirellulaceae bacterium]